MRALVTSEADVQKIYVERDKRWIFIVCSTADGETRVRLTADNAATLIGLIQGKIDEGP